MKFYLAPLEGITGYIYRNAVEKYFPGTDRYFTPFIAPDQNRVLRTKETRDVAPENNRVGELIPQILTSNAEHFIMTVKALQELGYEEVNLNLGCPSGTVVTKKRGSGFLAFPDELDRFLEQIFDGTDVRISIKTRVGRDDSSGAFQLMEIYRKYPLSELIIHPRTQKEFYCGVPDMELFGRLIGAGDTEPAQTGMAAADGGACGPEMGQDSVSACVRERNQDRVSAYDPEICFNGNLLTQGDYERFTARFPQVQSVMLGRGMLANPGLIRQLKTGEQVDKKTLKAFHDEVMDAYREYLSGDKNVIYRMKELWIYMIHSFSNHEKYAKKIRKAQSLAEYRAAVEELFAQQAFLPEGPVRWNLPQK